jgi:hypothetical protein
MGPRNPLRAAALQMLAEANRLAVSDPAAAAPLYAQLAHGAETLGRPRQAVHLHFEAAGCLARLGHGAEALQRARAALALIPHVDAFAASEHAYDRVINHLRAQHLNPEADLLEREARQRFGAAADVETEAPAAEAPAPGRLPTQCPQCGGAARSDEVEWIDAYSAECAYCGSVIGALGG